MTFGQASRKGSISLNLLTYAEGGTGGAISDSNQTRTAASRVSPFIHSIIVSDSGQREYCSRLLQENGRNITR